MKQLKIGGELDVENKPRVAVLAILRSGIGHYVAQLSPYLAKNFDIEYISYKYGLLGDEISLNDKAIANNIVREPFFGIKYATRTEILSSLKSAVEFLRQKNIDCLNIHIDTIARETAYYLISLAITAKSMGIKIVYTFHDVESFEDYPGGGDLLKAFYSLCDSGTVGSEAEREKLASLLDSRQDNIFIAPHGIYTLFNFNQYNKQSAREHLGIPQDKKVILNFGVHRPYKGFDDTMRAMPEILKAHPDAFLYVSSGIRVYNKTDDLEGLVDEMGIRQVSKVSFDFVPSEEIEPIFKASDIVVLPYKKVSQSGILNLAINFAKPVVLTNLFIEAPEIDGRGGIIINPGRPDEIAQAVNNLLSDRNYYQRCEGYFMERSKEDLWQIASENYSKAVYKALGAEYEQPF